MKAVVVILFLVVAANAAMMARLNKYSCFDGDFQDTSGKLRFWRGHWILARSEFSVHLKFSGIDKNIYFVASDNPNHIGVWNVDVVCILKEPVNGWAFTGRYNGEIYFKGQEEPTTIRTVEINPSASAPSNNQHTRFSYWTPITVDPDTLVPSSSISYMDSKDALISELTYHLIEISTESSTPFPNCRVEIGDSTFGCVPITDFSPNVRYSGTTTQCRTIQDSDPIARVNCGPTQSFTRKEETVITNEESLATSSSSTTTLDIGNTFSINSKVEVTGVGEAEASTEYSTSLGTTYESGSGSTRAASSVKTNSIERTFTLDHGRKLVEEAVLEECEVTSEARGCFDSACTVAFRLDYKRLMKVYTHRYSIATISCDQP